MESRYYLLVILLFFGFSLKASKLQWQVKREIGNTTIWKSTNDQKFRASTQVIKGKTSLNTLSNKKEFVKNLEKKKSQGMTFLGIRDWEASKYEWKENALEIHGTYVDNDDNKIHFTEKHFFLNNKRIICLLTSTKKNSLSSSLASGFFDTALKWEDRK